MIVFPFSFLSEQSDLILNWDIQNTSSYSGSGSTITDLQGNFNGTIVGTIDYTSGSPNYLAIQGSNSEYIVSANSLNSKLSPVNTGTQISYFLWIYPTGNGVILNEQGTTTPAVTWHDTQIEIVSGSLKFRLWELASPYLTSSTNITLNTWNHVGLTYDGTTLSAYLNGVQVASTTPFSRLTPYNDGGGIGLYYSLGATDAVTNMGDGNGATFRLGSFRVYNIGLSGTQVLDLYNETKSSYSIVTSSLFMKLDAANYTSGTWSDETGNGNNATINGATWSSSDGGIFDLDGINDTISISHASNLSLNTSTQRTIQVWVKFDALPGSGQQIPVFGKLSSSFGFDGYWGGLYSNSGLVRCVTNGTSAQKISDSTLTITTNNWYLFTFVSQITSTSNTTKVYINETEYITTAHGSDTYNETNTLYLGYIGTGVGSLYLNGKIGACYFYTKGLTSGEISTNYNATKSRYGL
jgi:hypothetical protein